MARRGLSLETSDTRSAILLLLASLLVVIAAAAVTGADPATRRFIMRAYLLFAGGLLAMTPPHILLPDPLVRFLQLGNPPPADLLRRTCGRWTPVVAALCAPPLAIAFFDPASPADLLGLKALLGAEGILSVAGIGLLSLARYSTMGRTVQEWQEGTRGRLYYSVMEHAPAGSGFGIPRAAIPILTATPVLFGLLITTVVAGAILGAAAGAGAALVPALLLMLFAWLRWLQARARFDLHYYRTNGLFEEVFRQGGPMEEGREAIPYGAVYWAPESLRPHVWAGLRQMDRRLPLGRFVALGHLLLWVMVIGGFAATFVAAYLLLFLTATKAALFVVERGPHHPAPWHLMLLPWRAWIGVRLFMNLRWTLPLALSLGVLWLIGTGLSFSAVVLWTGVDLLLSLLFATAATWRVERGFLNRYA
jgi:hypothetical protein